MRVCLMIEGQEGVTWEDWVALAQTCEQAGLEALFRSDHYTSMFNESAHGSLDAWATLSGLAALTSSLRLGTMVSPASFRHPSALAKIVVTADHISGGRVELGLGAGWFEREHSGYGFPFAKTSTRMKVLAEQLEIVHGQWTSDDFSFSGEHYSIESLNALPKPVQQPHPPLIVGGSGKKGSVELAARWADEYNTVGPTPERCSELRGDLDEACRRHGREPSSLPLSVMTTCIVGISPDEFQERVRGVLRATNNDDSPDDFVRESQREQVLGTVDKAVERLRAYEAAGVKRIMLQHLLHQDLDMVRLLGAAVAAVK
ncbi:MAG TPA: TIGR03560 family F420-dependent LLM class oxidoreductase [Actinomycetota bacterium]|nr:TIGR03560 family F420-dependent LLM class oxidoreductase [Actinomycetota bacterium]